MVAFTRKQGGKLGRGDKNNLKQKFTTGQHNYSRERTAQDERQQTIHYTETIFKAKE